MKYLDLCGIHEVNLALNFDTQDSAVIGGCDLYTTKAAGSDKKLYKRIEQTLEDRFRGVLNTMASMSPESASKYSDPIDLERKTPFGTFHDASNRHTFAYLISTLNATHIDYDFANTLKDTEFHRETKETFVHEIEKTMHYLRPQIYSQGVPAGATTPLGSPIWSVRSWQLLDSEMSMDNCEYYSWKPNDDPFADDGAIWSLHFFLYNKDRKRVCYFYLRGLSALSSSPAPAVSFMSRLKQHEASNNYGSRKRAEFWLGNHAKRGLEEYGESDELDNMVIEHPEDIVDADVVDLREREASHGLDYCSTGDDSDIETYLADHGPAPKRRKSSVSSKRRKSSVLSVDGHVAEQIKV